MYHENCEHRHTEALRAVIMTKCLNAGMDGGMAINFLLIVFDLMAKQPDLKIKFWSADVDHLVFRVDGAEGVKFFTMRMGIFHPYAEIDEIKIPTEHLEAVLTANVTEYVHDSNMPEKWHDLEKVFKAARLVRKEFQSHMIVQGLEHHFIDNGIFQNADCDFGQIRPMEQAVKALFHTGAEARICIENSAVKIAPCYQQWGITIKRDEMAVGRLRMPNVDVLAAVVKETLRR